VNSLSFSRQSNTGSSDLVLLAGCSDGFVRAFSVSEAGEKDDDDGLPLFEVPLAKCAVTRCAPLSSPTADLFSFVCGGSDGVLRAFCGTKVSTGCPGSPFHVEENFHQCFIWSVEP
jgi:hypothetical protein